MESGRLPGGDGAEAVAGGRGPLLSRERLAEAVTGSRLTPASTTITTIGALIATLGIVAALIAALGADPGIAAKALIEGAFASEFKFGQTIVVATVLVMTGLGAAIPFSAHLWNVGGEGQMLFGAFGAIGVALTAPADLPAWVFAPLVVVTGILAGAAWALVAGVLKAVLDANEIIVTLMLTFVAVQMVTLAIRVLWPEGVATQTRPVPPNGTLPELWPTGNVHVGTILAILCVAIAWALMLRTALGFEIRAMGFNPRAARMSGVRTRRAAILAFAIGGAFAGLAGATIVAGNRGSLVEGIDTLQYGFIGIAVALLARLNPALILPAAFFFSILRVGSSNFQAEAQIDPAVGDVLVATFILLLLLFRVIRLTYAQAVR